MRQPDDYTETEASFIEMSNEISALTEHNRLLQLENEQLAQDKHDAIELMSPSWKLAAEKEMDILARFVKMANEQFEIRDKLAQDKAELVEALGSLLDLSCDVLTYEAGSEFNKLLEKHK